MVEQPFDVFEENQQFRRAPPLVRVEKMFEEVQSKLPGAPKFLLCLLPERKNCDIYGLFYFSFYPDHLRLLSTILSSNTSKLKFHLFYLLWHIYCHVYYNSSGPWKKKNLAEYGIVTQCMAPTRVNDQYLTNVLLKVNAKVRYSSPCSCRIFL